MIGITTPLQYMLLAQIVGDTSAKYLPYSEAGLIMSRLSHFDIIG